MNWACQLVRKKKRPRPCKGVPWFTALTGSIERSTIPHGLDIQLPGVLRCRLGWLASQFLKEKSRASGIPNSPQKQGANHLSSTKLRLKIALIGKKNWGQKNYQPKESTIRLFFMGNPKKNYHTSLHSLIAPGCNLIPPGMAPEPPIFRWVFPWVDVKIDTLENQQGHNPFWANDWKKVPNLNGITVILPGGISADPITYPFVREKKQPSGTVELWWNVPTKN